ncbi:MAG: lytic murein transglycosylase, partial [Mesorhizobium sp.]
APLCPAGHLPHKGGDWQLRRPVHSCGGGDWRKPGPRPISPQVGEMSGRTEGREGSLQISIYPGPLHSSAEVTAWIPGSARVASLL